LISILDRRAILATSELNPDATGKVGGSKTDQHLSKATQRRPATVVTYPPMERMRHVNIASAIRLLEGQE
jgi:hypothetical protein